MKAWINSRFKFSTHQLCEQLKRLEPFAKRSRAVCVMTYRIIAAMLPYVHAWQPHRYFVIYHKGHTTDIILYEDINGATSSETMRTIKHVHDIDNTLKEMAQLPSAPLLYQASAVPIMVVVQGAECEIKTFDLNKVPFWKRREAVRRVENSLIQADPTRTTTWIQKAYVRYIQQDVGGMEIVSRHAWFGVLKISSSLATLKDWLQRQKRPIMSVRWAPIMLAEHLRTTMNCDATWNIILCPFEGEGFQLFVYHHQSLVLYRQGFINTFTEGGLQEEVQQTLRYIERLGYMPSMFFRVTAYGFEPPRNMKAMEHGEWQWKDMPRYREWLTSPSHSWRHMWRTLFQRPTLSQAELSPIRFISAWMAYHVPRWVCAMGVPLIHFTFWSMIVLWMKSSYLTHTIHTMEPIMGEQSAQQSQCVSRVVHAACFETFLNVYAHQPTSLLQRVTPFLGQVGIVQRIHYEGTKQNEQSIRFFFPNKMPKATLANIKKSLGEERFYVESTTQGPQNVLQITQRF